ncbi:MAG TPA: hypothetical protein VKT80_01790, partial [Chloroflexota bacterium]|nr:hypothetical protein [Chloroflexota bacterium]
SLVDKSLVVVEDGAVQTRYRSPETIGEYARDRLVESGEIEVMRARHAAYCLALADAWGLALLDREQDNVRAALRWFEERGDVAAGVRLVRAMCEWWHQNGSPAEGKAWLERFRSKPDFANAPLEVHARALMAEIYLDTRHDPVAARASSEVLQALGRKANNPEWQEFALVHLCWSSLELGELSRAEGELAQYLAVARELELPSAIAFAHILLGDLARLRGEDDLARERYQASLVLSDESEKAWQLRSLGFLAIHRGATLEAESLLRESLSLARTLPNTLDKIECLGACASLAAARGEEVRAARLLGAVDAALKNVGLPFYFGDRFERARTLDVLGDFVNETDFADAAAEGRTMTLEQAISYVMEGASGPPDPPPRSKKTPSYRASHPIPSCQPREGFLGD